MRSRGDAIEPSVLLAVTFKILVHGSYIDLMIAFRLYRSTVFDTVRNRLFLQDFLSAMSFDSESFLTDLGGPDKHQILFMGVLVLWMKFLCKSRNLMMQVYRRIL